MTPDELDAIEARRSDSELAPVFAALRQAWAEQSRLINESSAWLAGYDTARRLRAGEGCTYPECSCPGGKVCAP